MKSELQKEERMASAFLPTVRAPVLLKPEEICTDAGRIAQGPSRIAESRSMEQIKAALAEQSGLVPEDPPLGANDLGSLLRALSHQVPIHATRALAQKALIHAGLVLTIVFHRSSASTA